MNTEFEKEQQYIRAKKRLDNLKGFYSNIGSYCFVIPFLAFINYMTSPGYWWVWWPALGWGIGIIFHAIGVFGGNIVLGKDWENRKIKEFMDKDKNRF